MQLPARTPSAAGMGVLHPTRTSSVGPLKKSQRQPRQFRRQLHGVAQLETSDVRHVDCSPARHREQVSVRRGRKPPGAPRRSTEFRPFNDSQSNAGVSATRCLDGGQNCHRCEVPKRSQIRIFPLAFAEISRYTAPRSHARAAEDDRLQGVAHISSFASSIYSWRREWDSDSPASSRLARYCPHA